MTTKRKPEKKIEKPPGWEDRPGDFERFRETARGLMAVSKKDLDKELAKEERRKARKRSSKAA